MKRRPGLKTISLFAKRPNHQIVSKSWRILRTIEERYALSGQLASLTVHSKVEDFWVHDVQAVIFGKMVNPSEAQFSPL